MDEKESIRADIVRTGEGLIGKREALLHQLEQGSRAGLPAKELARLVDGIFSRDQVTEYLRAVDLRDTARQTLWLASLSDHVSIEVTGITPPREARLVVDVSGTFAEGLDELSARIRRSLSACRIGFAPATAAGYGADADLDEVLRRGWPVALVRVRTS